MNRYLFFSLALVAIAVSVRAEPPQAATDSPEAPSRTYAQNYRDMLLATCIARGYERVPEIGRDAGATSRALFEWTRFDMEHGSDEMGAVLDRYLKRDYQHPLVEYKGVRFELLKCLDMYHSADLDKLTKKWVVNPARRSASGRSQPIR